MFKSSLKKIIHLRKLSSYHQVGMQAHIKGTPDPNLWGLKSRCYPYPPATKLGVLETRCKPPLSSWMSQLPVIDEEGITVPKMPSMCYSYIPAIFHCSIIHTGVGKCPNWTSPNYWGYNLQQIFEGDVQNPQKGTFTNPCIPLSYSIHLPFIFPDVSTPTCANCSSTGGAIAASARTFAVGMKMAVSLWHLEI